MAGFQTPEALQHGLGTDLGAKSKFMFMTKALQWAQSKLPTKGGARAKLVEEVAELLKKPQDAKLMKQIMEEVNGDVNMTQAMKQMQRDSFAGAADRDIGMTFSFTSDGKVVPTSQITAKNVNNFQDLTIGRIASAEDIDRIATTEGISADSKSFDAILKSYGYKARWQGAGMTRVKFIK